MQTKIATFFLCLLVSQMMLAQSVAPIITLTVDSFSKLPDKYAPFDQRFFLIVPLDSQKSVTKVNVYNASRVSATGTWNLKSGNPVGGTCPNSMEITGKAYNNLHIYMPPLDPNKYYAVGIQYAMDKSFITQLNGVNELLCQGPGQYPAAIAKYRNFELSVNTFNAQTSANGIDNSSAMIQQSDYIGFYNSYLASDYSIVLNELTDFSLPAAPAAPVTGPLYTTLFNDLNSIALLCDDVHGRSPGNGELRRLSAGSSPDSIALFLCHISDLSATIIGQISQNNIGILDYFSTGTLPPVPAVKQLDKLEKNFAANLSFITQLRKYLMTVDFSGSVNISPVVHNRLISECNALFNALTARNNTVKNSLGNINTQLNDLARVGIPSINRRYILVQFLHLSSGTPDIQTSGGNYLIPDVGLLNMISFAENKVRYMMRPYYGVNISFRPINKNIRFKDSPRNHYVARHLSLSFGLTAYPLNNTNKNISDLLQTFSPVGGFNWRFGRMIRIGAGVVVYKMNNIENSNLPQIVTAMPYASFSVDLDVISGIQKLTGKILW